MKSKKQIRRLRNKSKKFRKMKGAGGEFSRPMTIPDDITLTPEERQQARTMRDPTATELAQQYYNTDLFRRAAAVFQHQPGFPEFGMLASVGPNFIDDESLQRMKEEYLKSEKYLNKVKKESKELWDEMNKSELKLIFRHFMNIYNNKRPEGSKLRTTEAEEHRYLYHRFTKQWLDVNFNDLYNKVVQEDNEEVEFSRTSHANAWAREMEGYIPAEQQFFYGIENELLFYESILEALNNYNNYKNRNRGWGSLQGIANRFTGGKRKTKKLKTLRRKTRKH